MKTLVTNIIGTYVSTGDTIANVDFAYITACILLIICFYYLMKFIFYIFK